MKTDKAFTEVEDFVKASSDTEITPGMKAQVADKLKEAKAKITPALITDRWIYRSVVFFLGLAILACVFFTYSLVMTHTGLDIKIPDIFLAIASAAVGALAGLLAPSPVRGENQ